MVTKKPVTAKKNSWQALNSLVKKAGFNKPPMRPHNDMEII